MTAHRPRARGALHPILAIGIVAAALVGCSRGHDRNDEGAAPASSTASTPATSTATATDAGGTTATAPAGSANGNGTHAGAANGHGAGTAANDRYDPSRMDFKSPPARVSSERHTGPFASGDALSMGAAVKPLVDAAVKEIRLDTTHKIVELAPGVRFSAWTFGDQVPGPVVRARVGDRIKFSMTNRSDEPTPGVRMTAAPMMHSMDFHSAMVAPNDKYRSIAPGQTIDFEFTANYPGVYMYHCGTPMVLEHIASGMYGMMIVEPREGYPTQVDREYAVVQSEFYTKLDPEGRKVDGQPLYVLDGDRVRAKQPTYTVFNGRYNGMVDQPLEAKPGERVRLFVLNVGPSNTSSFHVVGTIFDRVWLEGNPDNQLRGSQTVLLGSSNSAIVEFVVPEAGNYVMVDHHFANASQGAIGVLKAGDIPPGGGDPEHHNIPATGAPTDPVAVRGKLDFETKCLACHTIGGGPRLGPDLYGVSKRRNDDWLARWMKSPDQMLQTDPDAKAMLDQYKVPMPNQNLSDAEIRQYVAYFKWADEHVQPQGTRQPQPATPGSTLPPNQTLSGGAEPSQRTPQSPSSLTSAAQGRRVEMTRRVRRAGVAVAVVICASARAAVACGVCIEDKVAATYDWNVERHAAAAGHQVVYVEVAGPVVAKEVARAATNAAPRVAGVQAASIRTSILPPALSFALDPGKSDARTAVSALQARMGVRGLELKVVRVVGP